MLTKLQLIATSKHIQEPSFTFPEPPQRLHLSPLLAFPLPPQLGQLRISCFLPGICSNGFPMIFSSNWLNVLVLGIPSQEIYSATLSPICQISFSNCCAVFFCAHGTIRQPWPLKVYSLNSWTVIIDPFITLLFAAARLLFIWGLFQFMIDLQGGGEGKDGKQHMLWGVIGITVMFSVGGIINLVSNSIGVSAGSSIQIEGGFK